MENRNIITPNKKFMELAIEEAQLARCQGDYAIGAVLVKNGEVVAKCSNRSKRDESPIAHAETLVIMKASEILQKRHLVDCVLYCTHEPCPMCASVIVWAKLKGIVYGARCQDMKKYCEKNANHNYLWRTIDIPSREIFRKSTEKIETIGGFMRKECTELFHNER
jgi:tRNA(Arg) A34 adenosine deaminase TadA